MKTRILILAILAALITAGCAYAWERNDNSDRLSMESSNVFSPRYINSAKQNTDDISKQLDRSSTWWNNLVEKVSNKMTNQVTEDANTKVTPEIKKKTSSALSPNTNIVQNEVIPDLKIGSGSNKEADAGNKLIAETINGKRYVYAGFQGSDKISYRTIAQVMADQNTKSGDVVIVSSGTYNGFSIKSGVSIYGGYDENGVRGSDRSRITGADLVLTHMPCEINGFIFDVNVELSYTYASSPPGGASFGIGKIGVTIQTPPTAGTVVMENNIFNGNLFCHGSSNYSSTLTGRPITTLNKNTFNGSYTLTVSFGETANLSSNNFGRGYNIRANGASRVFSNNDYFAGNNIVRTGFDLPNQMAIIFVNNSNTQPNILPTSKLASANIPSTSVYYYAPKSFLNSAEALGVSRLSSEKGYDSIGRALKEMIDDEGRMKPDINVGGGMVLAYQPIDETEMQSALSVPAMTAEDRIAKEMRALFAMADIMLNPTEEQKTVLDAIKGLLEDVKEVEGRAGVDKDLSKAEDDLLNAVVRVLLAQGVPDLMKSGDMANLKGIFKELGLSRDKIMFDYAESIRPYYASMIKELESNMAVLQLNGILSNKLTQEELRKFEPKEVDRVIDFIRKTHDRSFEMERILHQEAKYREQYIEPSNRILVESMKKMMHSFTDKLNNALEEKK